MALPVVLSGLLTQIPALLVSLLGIVVSVIRWRVAPGASRWTLLASLLWAVTGVGAPLGQGLVMAYRQSAGLSAAGVGAYFTGLSLFWAVLRAASFALLLVAVYTGRGLTAGPPGALPPPPGYPPRF